jgi:hypothetical protein
MIDRVHSNSANLRAPIQVPVSTGFADVYAFMLDITYLPDSGITG